MVEGYNTIKDVPGKIIFLGEGIAELFSRQIKASFEGVLKYNFLSEDESNEVGFISASIDGRPWTDTMWSRDSGVFLSELVHWGYIQHACLLANRLIEVVLKNKEGFLTYPEYFKRGQKAAGIEMDGTAAIVIGMVLLWKRLRDTEPCKKRIHDFLTQVSSPLEFFIKQLEKEPLIRGTGEFGGGCGVDGSFYNVVQNSLVRIALLTAAQMQVVLCNHEVEKRYRKAADDLDKSIQKYLTDVDKTWIWCIQPDTMQPEQTILDAQFNKGFGGINGILPMSFDILGYNLCELQWYGIELCWNTLSKLLSNPKRKEQFDRYGIWTQFDKVYEGLLTSPSYGQGYAIQNMLLFDQKDMAEKALNYLVNATRHPVYPVKRKSIDHYYERYYSPDTIGSIQMDEGCGALNLVNVAEPLKIARLLIGIDDSRNDVLRIIPRVPPSWKGYQLMDWPILHRGEIIRIDMRYFMDGSCVKLMIKVKDEQTIQRLEWRLGTSVKLFYEITELESEIILANE